MKNLLSFLTVCVTILFFTSCQREVVTASFQQSGFHSSYHETSQLTPYKETKTSDVVSMLDREEELPSSSVEVKEEIEKKTFKALEEVPLEESKGKTNKKEKRLMKRMKKLKESLDDYPDEREISYSALASLIFGFSSLLLVWAFFTAPCAIIAASHTLRKMKDNPDVYKGKGAAIAGLILGVLGVVLLLFILAIFIVAAILFGPTVV